MAPTAKVTYFDIHGLGEPIKFILAYSNIDFEESRVGFDEWVKTKSSKPYGRLPVLEIDGKRLHQSRAISRYYGKKAGIGGDNDSEDLEIDIAVDTVSDLLTSIEIWFYERVEAAKTRQLGIINTEISLYTDRLDKQIAENGGYLANGKLSWADIFFVSILDYLDHMVPTKFHEHSTNINKLREKITNIPQIKKYLDNRKPYDLRLYDLF